jgi:hypothetical protein
VGEKVSVLRARRSAPCELSTIASFDAVGGAQVVDVHLPGDLSEPPHSHTVQSEVHPNLAPANGKLMHPVRVAVVPGGRLATSSGAVLTADGALVLETLWDEPHRRRAFDPPPALPEPLHVPGRHASLISVWCHNYHHWLFEALPRLAVLRASGVQFDRVIVPEGLAPFQLETLERAGIGEAQRLPFRGEHLAVDELVWASPPAPFERPTRFVIDWLRDAVGTEAAGASSDRRLYLRRAGGRRVANENELMRALGPLGFEAVMPERMSFGDQVALFGGSSVAVGAHGAAFSTAVFSRRFAALELYHSGLINASTLAALDAAGHEHWSLICKRVPGLHRPRHWDLRAPVDLVLDSLARIGVSR